MKDKMVKLRGPNGTTKEITAEEWAGYCPIAAFNNRMEEAIKFHKVRERLAEDEANGGYDDLAGHCDGPED
jgi:hypothetical protein